MTLDNIVKWMLAGIFVLGYGFAGKAAEPNTKETDQPSLEAVLGQEILSYDGREFQKAGEFMGNYPVMSFEYDSDKKTIVCKGKNYYGCGPYKGAYNRHLFFYVDPDAEKGKFLYIMNVRFRHMNDKLRREMCQARILKFMKEIMKDYKFKTKEDRLEFESSIESVDGILTDIDKYKLDHFIIYLNENMSFIDSYDSEENFFKRSQLKPFTDEVISDFVQFCSNLDIPPECIVSTEPKQTYVLHLINQKDYWFDVHYYFDSWDLSLLKQMQNAANSNTLGKGIGSIGTKWRNQEHKKIFNAVDYSEGIYIFKSHYKTFWTTDPAAIGYETGIKMVESAREQLKISQKNTDQ